jgi:pyruvate/oxaloacetate carboxyltransferase
MKTWFMLFIGILILGTVCAAAEYTPAPVDRNSEDYKLIKQACLDYVEGYYESNAARIEKGVHPDLVKRTIRNEAIIEMPRTKLIEAAVGKTRVKPKKITVEIYDIMGNIALAKITSGFVDYAQVGKVNGKWQVINVLWANSPK